MIVQVYGVTTAGDAAGLASFGPDHVGVVLDERAIVAAVEHVRPWGVDSETRTSRPDDRRRKDLDAVRRFIEAARTPVSAG